MNKTDHPFIAQMQADVQDHGEVHAVVSEWDDEVEVRLGTATFEWAAGSIAIDDGQTVHRIRMDDVVSYYLPVEHTH